MCYEPKSYTQKNIINKVKNLALQNWILFDIDFTSLYEPAH